MAIPLRPPVYPLESNELDEKAPGTLPSHALDNAAVEDKIEAMYPSNVWWFVGAAVVGALLIAAWRAR